MHPHPPLQPKLGASLPPPAQVRHFLDEFEARGAYHGVPTPGFVTQDMENPFQRAYLKVRQPRPKP